MQNKTVRYELLREAPTLKFMEHLQVRKAVLEHTDWISAPILRTGRCSIIPPWMEFTVDDTLTLAWGEVRHYPSNSTNSVYFVERKIVEPAYEVVSMLLDSDGFPLEDTRIPVGRNLILREALTRKADLRCFQPDRHIEIRVQTY